MGFAEARGDELYPAVCAQSTGQQALVFTIEHTAPLDEEDFVEPACRYWMAEEKQWGGDGCVVIAYDANSTTCSCSKPATFNLGVNSFIPSINVISLQDILNLTPENIAKHPLPAIVIGTVFLVYFVLAYVALKRDPELDLKELHHLVSCFSITL